jgi:hypothetical protein
MASTISAGTTTTTALVYSADTSGVLQLQTNGGTTALTLDTNQNVGIGVTPSAWSSNYKGLQMNGGALQVYTSGDRFAVNQNAFVNSGVVSAYVNNGYASQYLQLNSEHRFYTAPSGTAGNAITFTQAMLLDGNSNLTIAGSTATKASGTTWANPSDTRLKNNQALYTKGLTELNQIKVKTWVYNGLGGSLNGQTGIGVIADEAMIVLPDTVDTYSAKLNPTDSEETDIKRFNASEVIWLLVTSLQELDAKFESYKATHP